MDSIVASGNYPIGWSDYLMAYNAYHDRLSTIKMLRRHSMSKLPEDFVFESATQSEMKDGDVSNITQHENLSDVGGVMPDMISAGTSTYSSPIEEINKMGDFLKRPVQIFSSKWSMDPGGTDSLNFNVWDLWSKTPSVRSKLKNFAYLKGNLHIRFAISGTPFHYGKILLSYQPYPARNSVLANYVPISNVQTRLARCNYLSQAPGAYLVDVRENKPVEMVCPFISPKQMHRLWNDNGNVAAASSFEDLQEAGILVAITPTGIRAVNGNTDAPYFQIYAWMEDVELGTPTATVLEIQTESKREEDTGPVEKVSTQIARASGLLSKVPYIGEYASASQVAFSTVSKIASIFGWSRPVVIEKPQFVKNNAYGSPVCIGEDTANKISFDPYQGLSVDPSVCGGTGDDMCISQIASIPSIYDMVEWPSGLAPLSVLRTREVMPNITTVASGLLPSLIQPTALCFAVQPFKYWRGTIRFTIEIACTQFHRGKFLIGYEPNIDARAAILAAPITFNKQFQRVIDIQDTQKVEFDVEWNAARDWLENQFPGSTPTSINANGWIYLAPFTELISPDTTSSVYIVVSVSSPDLQVMGLSRSFLPTNRALPAGFQRESKRLDSSVPSSVLPLAPSRTSNDHVTQEHFGEEILSFRTLLKRFAVTETYSRVKMAATSLVRNRRPIYPVGTTYGTTGTSMTNFIDYLRFAYLGVRGGIRYRIQFNTPDMNDNTYIRLGLTDAGVSGSGDTVTALAADGSTMANMNANILGQGLFYRPSNGGVEAEIPYYSPNLFNFSFANDYIGTNPGGDRNFITSWFTNFDLYYLVKVGNDPVSTTFLISTAEDFGFMRFQGSPWYTQLA